MKTIVFDNETQSARGKDLADDYVANGLMLYDMPTWEYMTITWVESAFSALTQEEAERGLMWNLYYYARRHAPE